MFFDLPGTVNSEGVINSLAGMDYIFTPISADKVEMCIRDRNIGYSSSFIRWHSSGSFLIRVISSSTICRTS